MLGTCVHSSNTTLCTEQSLIIQRSAGRSAAPREREGVKLASLILRHISVSCNDNLGSSGCGIRTASCVVSSSISDEDLLSLYLYALHPPDPPRALSCLSIFSPLSLSLLLLLPMFHPAPRFLLPRSGVPGPPGVAAHLQLSVNCDRKRSPSPGSLSGPFVVPAARHVR